MGEPSTTRYVVEPTGTKVARRPQLAKDGAFEVYVTQRHRDILLFIGDKTLKGDYDPTFGEIAAACGYTSRTGAYPAIETLAKFGLVTWDIRRHRSIALTKHGRRVYEAWKEAISRNRKKVSS